MIRFVKNATGDLPFRPLPLGPYPQPQPGLGATSSGMSPMTTFLLFGAALAGLYWVSTQVYVVTAYDKQGNLVRSETFFDVNDANNLVDELENDEGLRADYRRLDRMVTGSSMR